MIRPELLSVILVHVHWCVDESYFNRQQQHTVKCNIKSICQ